MGVNHQGKVVTDKLGFVVDFSNPKSINTNTLGLTDIGPNKIPTTLTYPESNSLTIQNGVAVFSPIDSGNNATYYTISNSYFNNIKNEITLETCMNVTDTFGSAQYCRGVSPRTTETSSPLGFGVGNGYIGYEVNTSTGWKTGGQGNALCNNGLWIHISQTTSVLDNSFKTYVNGNLVATISLGGSIPNGGNGILIGRGFYGGIWNYKGKVSFVRVYEKALSASEIHQNFNTLRGRYGI